jgi:hypothetical protein
MELVAWRSVAPRILRLLENICIPTLSCTKPVSTGI